MHNNKICRNDFVFSYYHLCQIYYQLSSPLSKCNFFCSLWTLYITLSTISAQWADLQYECVITGTLYKNPSESVHLYPIARQSTVNLRGIQQVIRKPNWLILKIWQPCCMTFKWPHHHLCDSLPCCCSQWGENVTSVTKLSALASLLFSNTVSCIYLALVSVTWGSVYPVCRTISHCRPLNSCVAASVEESPLHGQMYLVALQPLGIVTTFLHIYMKFTTYMNGDLQCFSFIICKQYLIFIGKVSKCSLVCTLPGCCNILWIFSLNFIYSIVLFKKANVSYL